MMFVVKGNKEREVSLTQNVDGVSIEINGVIVARFDNDDDRIIFVGGITEEKTGLNASRGRRIQHVWDSDKRTSKAMT